MDATDWISIGIAAAAFLLSGLSFYTQKRQNFLFAGASSAIAWRQQVLDLYDRGLEPDQIRTIMLLEDGGAGYEASNGRIDEILQDVPRGKQSRTAKVREQSVRGWFCRTIRS